jgi:ATP-dependent Clp protease ATP-binding subunit ClpA
MLGLKEIKTHPSVKVAISMANNEACLSGNQYIEPFHILFAILNIVDDHYEQASESTGLTPEEIRSVGESAAQCRSRLKISDKEITAMRRQLHKILRSRESPLPLRALSLSNESTYLLQKAARRTYKAGTEEVNLTSVLEELLANLPKEMAPFLGQQTDTGPLQK